MPDIIAESSGYPYTNVAICKPAWQTSTVIDADGYAARAIDGSRNPIYVHGSCTHTYTEDYPSWAVDLGYVSPISMVNVTNRQGGLCMEIIHYTPLFWIVAFIVNSWLMWCIHSLGLLHWPLTHCDRVTHMWVGNLTNIGTDNGLSPGRNQAIIWTNVGILSIRPLGTNLSEFIFEIHKFWIKKMHLKRSSANWRSFFLSLNVLTGHRHNSDMGNIEMYHSKTKQKQECLHRVHNIWGAYAFFTWLVTYTL